MFRKCASGGGEARQVKITVDGVTVLASEGEPLAAALLRTAPFTTRKTAISGSARAPFCMMGVCFDCLVTIDGIGNRQGCLVRVREGMRIEAQHGKRDPEA